MFYSSFSDIYGDGVAVGEAVGEVVATVASGVLEGVGLPVRAGVLVGTTPGVAVRTPWMVKTRSTTSPNTPRKPSSCWLK
jgi:hypothetical protein